MSQAKVDKYKAEKAVRKQTIAKNKVKRVVGIVSAWVVVLAIIGWIGYSSYKKYEASRPINTYYVDGDAIQSYYEYVQGETETEGASEDSTEATTETESTQK